ncbi:MAG: hypothetical protein ACYDH5_13025 [Acidimicrobiales bacterium]
MIGRQLVPKLVTEGHDVVATARSSAKLAEDPHLGRRRSGDGRA